MVSEDVEWTGIEGLDFVMGGLPPNALTMFIGLPGTGKTILASQVAMRAAREGRAVIYLTAYSEPHEKLLRHMSTFSFFQPDLVGDAITMLSLKSVLTEGADATLEVVLRALRGKRSPLLVIDGHRGIRVALGMDNTQQFLSSLSSQLPYHNGSCLVASEASVDDRAELYELSPADALIALRNTRELTQPVRTLEILKVRGHSYKEGLHTFSIGPDGVTVYPRLASSLPPSVPQPSDKRYGFDLPEFDAMLGGGLPEFSTTVVLGDPGTGKTTSALHYLLAGAALGEPGLLVTLQETASDLLQKAGALGLPLAASVESGSITILEVPPVEIEPVELAWRIRSQVEACGTKRVVIDTITALEDAVGGRQAQSDYLAALSVFFRRSGVTTVMTRSLIPGEASLERVPIAQNRILLRRVQFGAQLYRVCSVINMERSDHDTSIREFTIGRGGIQILSTAESEKDLLAGIARDHSFTLGL